MTASDTPTPKKISRAKKSSHTQATQPPDKILSNPENIVFTPSKMRQDRSETSDDKTYMSPSQERSEAKGRAIPAISRVVQTTQPVLTSQMDPTKRNPFFKEPTPDSEWRPEWRPRKKPVGSGRQVQKSEQLAAELQIIERQMGLEVGTLDKLPRDPETGRVVKSPEAIDALLAYVSQGGMVGGFAIALGLPKSTVWNWVRRGRENMERFARARAEGADAIAEDAFQAASQPMYLEDKYESYDGNGNLIRRDIKTSDASYARKLAFSGRMELLKRWAPEKYGDKPEVKTTDSMAEKLLAARRRLREG